MKSCILFVQVGLILLLSVSAQGQPPKQEWVARYNGPGNGDDIAYTLVIDSSGNVYVTGMSLGKSTNYDYATIKYDPNGMQMWVARYNGSANRWDEASALAADNSRNVYVTGISTGNGGDYDYATVKYDPNGNELWVARYNGTGNDNDNAKALAVDDLGYVYVTGCSLGDGTYSDYVTIKYDSNGNECWVARYNGPDNDDDCARAIGVDDSGNVYVTGTSWAGYSTVKYDPNGNQLYVGYYPGFGGYDLAIDDSDNLYVTGYSWYNGTGHDYTTIKYDPNGNKQWVARYNGPRNDYDWASSVKLDSRGIYVTGRSKGIDSIWDYATIKYAPDGKEVWVARYDATKTHWGIGEHHPALGVDNSGNVYVTGPTGGLDRENEYTTIKYEPNGNEAWVARYHGPGDEDVSLSIGVDNSGSVCVTGFSKASNTRWDYTTIKYTQHDYCTGAITSDLNGNCKVDFGDFAILAEFGLEEYCLSDVAVLVQEWLKCNFALHEDCW
jgi:hypothetical protein